MRLCPLVYVILSIVLVGLQVDVCEGVLDEYIWFWVGQSLIFGHLLIPTSRAIIEMFNCPNGRLFKAPDVECWQGLHICTTCYIPIAQHSKTNQTFLICYTRTYDSLHRHCLFRWADDSHRCPGQVRRKKRCKFSFSYNNMISIPNYFDYFCTKPSHDC